MGYVDPNRLGIVAAVMLTAWHAVWMALVAAGVAQRVAEFTLRMHAMKSDVVIEPFDPGMASLLETWMSWTRMIAPGRVWLRMRLRVRAALLVRQSSGSTLHWMVG